MADGVKSRRYVSPRRDEQARRTRHEIVAAAHRRFVARGYAATRVEEVARDAGVATQTVYSAVGNKRDLLWAVLEASVAGDDGAGSVEQQFRDALDGAETVDERLARAVTLGRRLLERSFDAHRIMRGAASSDPAVAEALEEAERRRRRDVRTVAGLVAAQGTLDAGELAAAADFLDAVTGYETYEHLVRTCRWPTERYEQWIVRALWPAFSP